LARYVLADDLMDRTASPTRSSAALRAFESVDWKKLGVATGIVVGATFTLLFAVLIAAELNDDHRPAAATHLASSQPSLPPMKTVLLAPPLPPTQPVAAPQVAAEEPATSIGELDDPEPAPAPVKRPAAKKAKPKGARLSFRNADVIFNP